MKTYRVSLTEKINRDWVVEVEAATAEEAEEIASERFADIGTMEDSGGSTSEILVDWSEEIGEAQ